MIMLGLSVIPSGSAVAQQSQLDNVGVSDLQGDGTQSNPYEITDVSELQAMEDDLSANYSIVNDIDASQITGFDSIARGILDDNSFSGSLDGNNHTITGLNINGQSRVVIFGRTSPDANIRNLNIKNISIEASGPAGSLVAENSGVIKNVSVSGEIKQTSISRPLFQASGGLVGIHTGSEIQNSSFSGTVEGGTAGGLVGSEGDRSIFFINNKGSPAIKDVSVSANVSGEIYAGGLIGSGDGMTIQNAIVSSNVTGQTVGGIAGSGKNSGIHEVTVSENITGNNSVGGLIGFSKNILIKNTTPPDSVTGQDVTGGLFGDVSDSTIQNVTTPNRVIGANVTGGIAGEVSNVTIINVTSPRIVEGSDKTGGLIGKTDTDSIADGKESSKLKSVGTPGSINGLNKVGGVIGVADNSKVQGVTVSGQVDGSNNVGGIIGFDSRNSKVRIGSVSGSVEGSNNTGGIIGKSRNNSRVKDVTVSGAVGGSHRTGGIVGSYSTFSRAGKVSNATVTSNIDGLNKTGGLVGVARDISIQNSTVTGDVSGSNRTGGMVGKSSPANIMNVTASGNVSGANRVGGIVGTAGGKIQNAKSSGDITGKNMTGGLVGIGSDTTIKQAIATGSVEGKRFTGGLIGMYTAQITTSSRIVQNVTATGDVDGGDYWVGGLIGWNSGTIRHAAAYGDVNGSISVGGLVGKNHEDIEETFAVGAVTGTENAGGLVGTDSERIGTPSVSDSYWDRRATGQTVSAGGGTGLTTTQMTGTTAQTSMNKFAFGTIWETQSNDYPILITQPDVNITSSADVDVKLTNVSITPTSIDNKSSSTHRLTFEAQGVSADGSEDNFEITFPDKVNLKSFSDPEIEENSSNINKNGNKLEFSVNSTGGGSTRISSEINVTLSATN